MINNMYPKFTKKSILQGKEPQYPISEEISSYKPKIALWLVLWFMSYCLLALGFIFAYKLNVYTGCENQLIVKPEVVNIKSK